MPLRPVPWAIGNGAENSVELARAGTFVGSNGSTGIIGIKDFKVSALPVPGEFVRVTKGTGVIASTYPGVFGQSYTVQEQSFTDVPVAPTGSSGGATRYLYILIEDTQYGGQTPASVENGPYNDYVVSTTLPANQPYLLLAKIVQPKSTATIQNSHIEDAREVAIPYSKPGLRTYALVVGDTQDLNSTSDYPDGGQTWPRAVEEAWGEIDIPEWAVWVRVMMMWNGVRSSGVNVYGKVWVQIGPTVNEHNMKTQTINYNTSNPSDITRDTIVAADMSKIHSALRGTSQKFYPRGNREGGSGRLRLDGGSSMVLQFEFMNAPD